MQELQDWDAFGKEGEESEGDDWTKSSTKENPSNA
jgi:hypothetical protein